MLQIPFQWWEPWGYGQVPLVAFLPKKYCLSLASYVSYHFSYPYNVFLTSIFFQYAYPFLYLLPPFINIVSFSKIQYKLASLLFYHSSSFFPIQFNTLLLLFLSSFFSIILSVFLAFIFLLSVFYILVQICIVIWCTAFLSSLPIPLFYFNLSHWYLWLCCMLCSIFYAKVLLITIFIIILPYAIYDNKSSHFI